MSGTDEKAEEPSPPPSRSGGRRWAGRVLYVLFLLIVVELSFQAFYRITTGSFLTSRSAVSFFVADPDSGWAPKPNLSFRHGTPEFSIDVFTNSRGFRTSKAHEEYATGHEDSRYRILLLGPSFAFGWGVNYEQTFAAQLAAMLAQKGFGDGRKMEVINRGVPAMPPANNLNWFKHVGKTYEPDLVIQFLYGSMDVNPAESLRVKDGYLVSRDQTLSQRVKARVKSSAIVFYGWMVVTKVRSAFSGDAGGGKIEGAGREMKLVGAFDPSSPGVTSSLAFYDDLRAAVEGSGARLLLVYFPLSYIVHSEDLGRWRHLGVQDAETQAAFDRAFSTYLGERGVTCLNLTEALTAEASTTKRRMYYWLDIHWTAEGNKAAARAVAEWLATRPEWAKRL